MHGLLLFAHGARDARWAMPFEAVAVRLQALRPDAVVRLAFLEFMVPSLVEAIDGLARSGCSRVDVVPLFLGAGGHVRQDVPVLLEQARHRHPGLTMVLHPAAGEDPRVIEALALAAAAAGAREPDRSDRIDG